MCKISSKKNYYSVKNKFNEIRFTLRSCLWHKSKFIPNLQAFFQNLCLQFIFNFWLAIKELTLLVILEWGSEKVRAIFSHHLFTKSKVYTISHMFWNKCRQRIYLHAHYKQHFSMQSYILRLLVFTIFLSLSKTWRVHICIWLRKLSFLFPNRLK